MTIWIEFIAQMTASTTNRWTGGTGSAFRIKRDPVKLLGKRRGPVNSTVLRLGCHNSANLISFLVLYFVLAISAGSAFGSSGVLHAMRAFQYAEAMPKYQKGLDSQSAKSKWKSWRLSTLCIQTWMI